MVMEECMQVSATSWDLRSLFSYSSFVVLMLGVFLFVVFVPVIKLLRRTGHSAFWCLLAIFPGVNVIAFWIFAFKPWPTDGKS
jgi:uncharacterized membrane protein YhaH (DUF805 family)